MATRLRIQVEDDFVEEALKAAVKDAHRRLFVAMPTCWQRVVVSYRLLEHSPDAELCGEAARRYLEAPDHGADEALGRVLSAFATQLLEYSAANGSPSIPAAPPKPKVVNSIPATHNCDEDA